MNVIYFSGSGNTKHCAQLFSKLSNNSRIYSIEEKEALQLIKESETFALAYPIHYSNIPFIVKDFIIQNKEIFQNKKIFLIATMGLFSGDGTGCAGRLLKKHGGKIIGGIHLQLPDSIGDVKMLKKTKEQNLQLIHKADKKIEETVCLIQNGTYPQEGLHFYNHIAGLFGQRLWFLHTAKKNSRNFKCNFERCTGCRLCSSMCPTKSIEILNGKATLTGTNCTICYRCVNSCPNKAITIIGKKVFEQCSFKKYEIKMTGEK